MAKQYLGVGVAASVLVACGMVTVTAGAMVEPAPHDTVVTPVVAVESPATGEGVVYTNEEIVPGIPNIVFITQPAAD